jgi:hypothetical protein
MSERYRLVFRGEVLDGQHKAVVKQRLGAALKVDGERLDAMFTGKAVTIRKDADTDTATRFQAAFKRAGARLRALPIAAERDVEQPATSPEPVTAAPNDAAFQLAPPGALMADPAPTVPQPAVDLSHLTLAPPGAVLGVPSPTVDPVVPDVSHLALASLGALLGIALPPPIRIDAPAWEVADVGADLAPQLRAIDPPFELDVIEFEVAPVGTLLVDADDEPAPQPPDTSHLHLQ